MSIFDGRRAPLRSKGCAVCGEPSAMVVAVQARQLKDRTPKGPAISRQRNYCAEHGEALFLKLVEQIGQQL